ncbi:hypothetical protein TIFTF001_033929 [Ficus carica]|uniref:Uncharacterized protein n=1 Tax=Ficus carica TaxID=3494 RepID=A0AA88E073_FICCA|nr:hypothetical protein TIFTF001_033929 [Ficus carica]
MAGSVEGVDGWRFVGSPGSVRLLGGWTVCSAGGASGWTGWSETGLTGLKRRRQRLGWNGVVGQRQWRISCLVDGAEEEENKKEVGPIWFQNICL